MTNKFEHNYKSAWAYLKGAKEINSGRPIGSNTRLIACKATGSEEEVKAVGVKLHSTIVVAYLADGGIVLNSGGWRTLTTSSRIGDFSPARVRSVKGDWSLATHVTGTTAPRVSKCRRCHGAGQVEHTTSERYHYGPCVEHPDKRWGHFHQLAEPVTTVYECSRCDGAGRKDYGSNPIHKLFVDFMVVDGEGKATGRRVGELGAVWIDPAKLYTDKQIAAVRKDLLRIAS